MNQDLALKQGSTFNPVFLFQQIKLTSKVITAITKAGQALVTAATHGLTVDWPVYIVGVTGMAQINNQPGDLIVSSKAVQAYFVDANTLRLNEDTTRYAAYISGGEVLYYPPIDLTLYTARMQIRPDINSATIIDTFTDLDGIILGGVAGTVKLSISAIRTASYTFDFAVYDLELVDGSGVVTRFLQGNVTLDKEVTR